jgi:GT2 family glycosyltransferase
MTVPTVTVVTPTHQRRRLLARVLEGLARQSCPAGFFSVVLACDGCTDGTQEMLRSARYPFQVQVLELSPGVGPAAARNGALLLAEAPIVLFLDDDVVPTEQLVAIHASRHVEQQDLVVIGPLLASPGRQQPWIHWEADTLQKQYAEMQAGTWAPTPRQFYTGNASVRRQHLLAAGGFDPRLRRGEDVELAFRLQSRGLRFVFEPAASGIHCARRSFGSWMNAAYEYGRVESAMGPVWGTHGLVDSKTREFESRHPIVRRTVAFALEAPRWAPAIVAAGRVAGRALAAVGFWRLARGVYTTLFEMAYWRGVETVNPTEGKAPDPPAQGIKAAIR